MAMEYKIISNKYEENNARRDFGLISWVHLNELYPWKEMLIKKINNELCIMDKGKLGWNYENAMSYHNLLGAPSMKLWPNPSRFLLNGTEYAMCMNGFGLEGRFHLGSCKHIYHPVCLISLMVARRRCVLCKAPFHECLYKLFGLTLYMPINWEYSPENLLGLHHAWGEDLVWSWRHHDYSHNENTMSSQFVWENHHEEIVKVTRRKFESYDCVNNSSFSCFGHR
jgi:hypothetical protein